MIKLSDNCYVAHDQIAEVRINEHATSIVVRMKSGIGHSHNRMHWQTIHEALDDLVAQINAPDVRRLPADDTEGGEI